jgi:hypothetical protein
MALWDPEIAVLHARAIPSNLLAFITNTTYQRQALNYFGGSELPLIENLSQSVANRVAILPIFPAIAFVDDNDAQAFEGDLINGGYSATFELMIQNADPDTAVLNARVYDYAIKSMIANIAHADLIEGTGCVTARLDSIEAGFDEIKAHEDRENDWLQRSQIKVTYLLHRGVYA